MGRIFGGIDEHDLRNLIRSELQDFISYSDGDIHKIILRLEEIESQRVSDSKEFEEMHLRLEKVVSQIGKRPDLSAIESQMQALQSNLKHKASLMEVDEKINSMDARIEGLEGRMENMDDRMEKKLEAPQLEGALGGMEGRFTCMVSGKCDIEAVEELDDKIASLIERVEKAESMEASELLERLMAAEQVIQDKADFGFIEEQVSSLKQVINAKADAGEVQEGFEDMNKRLRIKADVVSVDEKMSVFHERLHRKVELAQVQACEDRLDRCEHHLEETPDIDSIVERLEMIDRKLQQKADNAAIDASLDDMDQRLQLKADDSSVQDRLQGVDCRLQSKADAQIISSRLGSLEQRLIREAEDIHHIKQEVSTKVDAAFVAATVSANQVYIMQEVETMNITQNKQFNVMNNHHSGPSSDCSTPQLQQEPKIKALQNGGYSEQQVSRSAGSAHRGTVAKMSKVQRESAVHQGQSSQPIGQQPQQQQVYRALRERPASSRNSPRSKSMPRLGRGGMGHESPQQQTRPAGRPMSRSVSRGRGSPREVEASARHYPAGMATRPRHDRPAHGGNAYRSMEYERRTSVSDSQERRTSYSSERPMSWGAERRVPSQGRRGDTTPPRYRSRSPELTPVLGRGSPRSRSQTPGSEYAFEDGQTPPKNSRAQGSGHQKQQQQQQFRIWACKRYE